MSDTTQSAAPVTKPVPKKPTPKTPPSEGAAAAGKPAPAKKAAPAERRFFLFTAIGFAWTTFTGALAAMSLGTLRFMFPNVLAEPPSIVKTGLPANQFEPGKVNIEWVNNFGIWIVNVPEEKKLIALSTICTHLGCTPSWLETDQKFKCPCHGSGFYMNGVNFEGPAPRPLERFAIAEVEGVVVVDKSKKFQKELQQWNDPESFISV